MNELPYASETLHIALVSLPQHDILNYIHSLKKNFYTDYNDDILSFSNSKGSADDQYLYKPLVYYIFGNYDIAFLSLVNNYKFAQKQMMPKANANGEAFYPESNSFQIITGSCPVIHEEFSAQDFFKKKLTSAEQFICISNLKLNNKLLIGNGNNFLQPLLKLIDKKIRAVFDVGDDVAFAENYFVQQSHSWFELTLVVFADKIEDITHVLTSLRHSSLQELGDELPEDIKTKDLLVNSIYQNLIKEEKDYDNVNPHLFADTHSYFGVHFDRINGDAVLQNVEDLRTQIEWQVKPGHISDLRAELEKISGQESMFHEKKFLLTGKTDYFIQEKEDKLSNNIKLLQSFTQNKDIFKFIRKTKTRVFLEDRFSTSGDSSHGESHPSFKEWLHNKNLTRNTSGFNELNAALKRLKISRNVRSKINKIFYNYNNGIQDPILFTYFLDFKIFIHNLCQMIAKEDDVFCEAFSNPAKWEGFKKKLVHDMEKILVQMIDIFDEGYNTRMLNCHNYEDITDFDLDFNSSVQQLLTTYNTISANISNIFYKRNAHGPVVLLYLKNTVSSYESINYDVYHLTSPEFVFFTLIKEVLNKFIYGNEEQIQSEDASGQADPRVKQVAIAAVIEELKREVEESKLKEYLRNGLMDFEYYYLDAVKFIHTCNLDFPLYEYWFWSYNFQNTSMYDRVGTFNEEHFKKELMRLCFMARMFDIAYEELHCPLPEIYYLWERHFKSIRESLDHFFKGSKNISQFKSLIVTIFKYPSLPPVNEQTVDEKKSEERYDLLISHIRKDKSAYNPEMGVVMENGGDAILSHAQYTYTHFRSMEDKLKKGIPVYCKADDVKGYHFINCLIYASLHLVYDRNKQVCLLRRDWENGNALSIFLQSSTGDNLYFIDQFGGIFFANNEKSAEYFRIRNAVLQSLWHYSLLCKKEIHFNEQAEVGPDVPGSLKPL